MQLQLHQPQQMGPAAMRLHLLEEECRRFNQDKHTQHSWQVAFAAWAEEQLEEQLKKALDATAKVSEELQVMKEQGRLQAAHLQQEIICLRWVSQQLTQQQRTQQHETQQAQQHQMQQMQADIQRLTETLAHQQQQLQQLQHQMQQQHVQQVPEDAEDVQRLQETLSEQQQTQQSQPVHQPLQQRPFEAPAAEAPPIVVPDLVAMPESSAEATLPWQLQQQQQPVKVNMAASAGLAAQGQLRATQAMPAVQASQVMPAAQASQARQAEQVTRTSTWMATEVVPPECWGRERWGPAER
jgi:hypothetical protein